MGELNGRRKVLVIEDNPDDLAYVRQVLGDSSAFELEHASSLTAGLQSLAKQLADVVLLDLILPDSRGLETLLKAQNQAPDVPIVVLTSIQDERMAVQAVQAGAQDYLIKGRMTGSLLGPAIRYAIERHHSTSNFRNVIVRNADGILIVDRNGIIYYMNPAAEGLLRKKAADCISQPFNFPMVPGEIQEIVIKDDQGKEVKTLEMSVATTEWKGEGAYIASLRDVTEWKKVTRALKEHNEKLIEIDKLKTAFISNVSHELRTPLTVIMSSANNLLGGALGGLKDAQQEWVGKIKTHAERLHSLITDILDLSKLESGTAEMVFENVDLHLLTKNLVTGLDLIAAQHKVRLTNNVPAGMSKIWCAPGRIEQILTNLVTNAFKFTPAGGQITIGAKENQGAVEVSVSDTGPGIAAEHRDAIFDRFRQIDNKDGKARTQGIGLGLALCKEIISQHKGHIWVESEPGKGSDFIFKMPVDFRQSAVTGPAARSILVVDDDSRICDLMKFILSKKGYKVTVITNGNQAVDTVKDKSQPPFDLIFLDMMLPGSSGVAVLKTIRENQPQAKVVIVTAYPKSDLSILSMESSVTLLPKPFNLQDIERVTKNLLDAAPR